MRKFTSMMLMLLFAVTTWAQVVEGQMYRIMDNTRSKYLTITSYNGNSNGAFGTVPVIEKAEGNADQVWYLESTGTENQYYLISKSGYYLVCRGWCLDANNTGSKSVITLSSTGDGYYLKNGNSYFKVEDIPADNGTAHPFCDAGEGHQNIVTWTFETVDASEFSIVSMDVINTEYDAAKAAAQAVVEKNLATAEKIAAINTALTDAETAYNALTITDNTISDADATTFREKITAINNATNNAKYLVSMEDLSNSLIFAIESNGRGNWVSNGSAITGTQKAGISADVTSTAQQFALIKSADTDSYYLYSVADAKFASKSGNGTTLTEIPTQAATLLASTNGTFNWVVALVAGEDSYNHMGVSNGYDPAVITFWNDLNDAGNQSRLELVGTLNDEAVTAALANIHECEFPTPKVQDDITINWTAANSAWWGDAVAVPDYTSTAINTGANGAEVRYATAEIEATGARVITTKFQYTSGNCALKTLGFEIVDANSNVIAGDYHSGSTGNNSEGNVYTVNVPEAGTYTARFYVWSDGSNRLDATNGTITISFDEFDTTTLSHTVNFVADYATLHLGYKVAIPEGVEAYVVSGLQGWALLAPVTNVIPAATPVILKRTNTEKSEYTFAYTETAGTTPESNLLRGSIANQYVVADAYVLANGANGVGLYKTAKNQLDNTAFLNNANKVYMVASEGNQALSYSFNFDWAGTTGIEGVEAEGAQNGKIYDITGREVKAITVPGIYIVNGKKVVK
ncbi:MAG: hypothetical protein IJX41_00255 [Bacteroidaceae bacterium]|nr:hypothetical protein [Bacteroidaceae bacterium]